MAKSLFYFKFFLKNIVNFATYTWLSAFCKQNSTPQPPQKSKAANPSRTAAANAAAKPQKSKAAKIQRCLLRLQGVSS
ncbi:MAG: hypothetical protein IJO54_07245 [Oscillospiraceae bacterium]|nr:hypothetical protein [Oscillospiraceae bacterium]